MAAQDYEQVTYNGPAGAQIGAAATDKIGFYGATPVVQRATATTHTLGALATLSLIGYTVSWKHGWTLIRLCLLTSWPA